MTEGTKERQPYTKVDEIIKERHKNKKKSVKGRQ
jgi:hypothetical protein